MTDDPLVLPTRTTLLVVEGRVHEAIPLQERLVRSAGPGAPVAMNNLAYLYRVSGSTGKARQVLERIVATGGAYADVWYNFAEVEHQENNFEEAVIAFERAWKEKPGDERFARRLAQERIDLARRLARSNRSNDAVYHLRLVMMQSEDSDLRETANTELDRLGATAGGP